MIPSFSTIPESWLSDPPETLIIGDGPYAQALGLILGAVVLDVDDLIKGAGETGEGGLPLVLSDLRRAIIVAGASESASDLLRCHEAIWRWIEKLSPEGEQHEIATLFVLPPSSADAFSESLAVGMGMENLNSELGVGFARMGDSLESLCRAASAIHPSDLPPLRALQARNARHRAIRQLLQADTPGALSQAARNVSECFHGMEYHLDLFCQAPSHRNGNLMRQWLRTAVTEAVTPEFSKTARINLAEWLRPT